MIRLSNYATLTAIFTLSIMISSAAFADNTLARRASGRSSSGSYSGGIYHSANSSTSSLNEADINLLTSFDTSYSNFIDLYNNEASSIDTIRTAQSELVTQGNNVAAHSFYPMSPEYTVATSTIQTQLALIVQHTAVMVDSFDSGDQASNDAAISAINTANDNYNNASTAMNASIEDYNNSNTESDWSWLGWLIAIVGITAIIKWARRRRGDEQEADSTHSYVNTELDDNSYREVDNTYTSEHITTLNEIGNRTRKFEEDLINQHLTDAKINAAQKYLSEVSDALLNVKSLGYRLYVLYEFQSLIFWAKGNEEDAKSLAKSASIVKETDTLMTQTANEILERE